MFPAASTAQNEQQKSKMGVRISKVGRLRCRKLGMVAHHLAILLDLPYPCVASFMFAGLSLASTGGHVLIFSQSAEEGRLIFRIGEQLFSLMSSSQAD